MANIILESAIEMKPSIVKESNNELEFITVLQSADTKNRNGRIYPKSVLESAIDSPYIRERLSTGGLFAECGHPMDTSVQRQMTVDMRNVACVIEELWWEGNLLKARCKTANTEVGRDIKGLIEGGWKAAFSLRAQGNVHNDITTGAIMVESPLQICTWDLVLNPSHSEAFMEKICEETVRCLYGTNKQNVTASMLCESAEVFDNGCIIDANAQPVVSELDFTKNYTPKLKKYADMYVPEEGDTVISMDEEVTMIRNGNVIKKVLTEDFLVKDIRSRIDDLNEGVVGALTTAGHFVANNWVPFAAGAGGLAAGAAIGSAASKKKKHKKQ